MLGIPNYDGDMPAQQLQVQFGHGYTVRPNDSVTVGRYNLSPLYYHYITSAPPARPPDPPSAADLAGRPFLPLPVSYTHLTLPTNREV